MGAGVEQITWHFYEISNEVKNVGGALHMLQRIQRVLTIEHAERSRYIWSPNTLFSGKLCNDADGRSTSRVLYMSNHTHM